MQKNLIRILVILIIITSLLVALFGIFKVHKIILKKVYPIEYSEYVYKYSKEYNVDPILVFAIIKAESNFNPDVVSSSKAIGLMQLMDTTAEEISRNLQINFKEGSTLYNPELNIKLGTKYFSNLIKVYNNNYLLALTAYNKWIEQGVIKEDGSDIENIPFKETNNYVRKILRDYKIYQNLYNN